MNRVGKDLKKYRPNNGKRGDSGKLIKSKLEVPVKKKQKPKTENGRKKTIWDSFKSEIFGSKN